MVVAARKRMIDRKTITALELLVSRDETKDAALTDRRKMNAKSGRAMHDSVPSALSEGEAVSTRHCPMNSPKKQAAKRI